MRIAIIGSGVSGLVAAHLLRRRAAVTVFEASGRIGGHVNTIDVDRHGRRWAVDTGFIVYNEHNYPNFTKLLANLGVETQASSMSFSVRSDRPALEYNGTTFRQLFAQRRNLVRPRFYRMLRDIVRFNRVAPAAAANGAAATTLGDYVHGEGYSPWFVDHYLVPMGAAIWSSPRARILEMPLAFFVRFFSNHGMLTIDDRPEWRVIRGGSRMYVDALIAPFRDAIRLHHPIHRVTRTPDGVTVDGAPFDQVVFACHSDQALRILGDATPREREILGAIPFQGNDTVLHTDRRVLPRRRPAWAAWNYHGRADADTPVGVTYNMNILQSLAAPDPFCVTLNDHGEIEPGRIVERIWYEHPLYTTASVAAQRRHREISGLEHRTHFCGAYWGNGFHEDGVNSALAVGAAFGVGR